MSTNQCVGHALLQDMVPAEKNDGDSITTQPSSTESSAGAVDLKKSKLPNELKSGVGLTCKANIKEQFLIFSPSKETVGFPIFERDAVHYLRFKVAIWPDWLTWFGHQDLVTKTGVKEYRLNRKSLTLYDDSDGVIFKCSLIAPIDLHGIVTEMIEDKLRGNKL